MFFGIFCLIPSSCPFRLAELRSVLKIVFVVGNLPELAINLKPGMSGRARQKYLSSTFSSSSIPWRRAAPSLPSFPRLYRNSRRCSPASAWFAVVSSSRLARSLTAVAIWAVTP